MVELWHKMNLLGKLNFFILCFTFLLRSVIQATCLKKISSCLSGNKDFIPLRHLNLVLQTYHSFESYLWHFRRYLRYFFVCYSKNMLKIWLSILLLSFLIFMSSVSFIKLKNKSIYYIWKKTENIKLKKKN